MSLAKTSVRAVALLQTLAESSARDVVQRYDRLYRWFRQHRNRLILTSQSLLMRLVFF
jgi:hypothetical protein